MGLIVGIICGFFLGFFCKEMLGRLWFFYLIYLTNQQRKQNINNTIEQLEDHANNED